MRQQRSRPRVEELKTCLRQQYDSLSPANQVAKAIAYSLNRWDGLARFLDDGRLCMTNSAAERALRGIAVGRRNWTFACSDTGGQRAAVGSFHFRVWLILRPRSSRGTSGRIPRFRPTAVWSGDSRSEPR